MLVQFTFAVGKVPQHLVGNYEGCVAGCDSDLNELFGLDRRGTVAPLRTVPQVRIGYDGFHPGERASATTIYGQHDGATPNDFPQVGRRTHGLGFPKSGGITQTFSELNGKNPLKTSRGKGSAAKRGKSPKRGRGFKGRGS